MANSMLWVAKLTVKLCGQRPPSSAPQQRRALSVGGEQAEECGAEVAADEADEGLPLGLAEGGADAAMFDALEEGVEALDGTAASKRTVAAQVIVGGAIATTTVDDDGFWLRRRLAGHGRRWGFGKGGT